MQNQEILEIEKDRSVKELEILFSEGKTINYKGKDIVIKPYSFKSALKAIKIIASLFKNAGDSTVVDLLEIISDNEASLIALIKLAVNDDTINYEELLNSEVSFDVVTSVFMVNKDFFTEKIVPTLSRLGLMQ